MRKVLKMALGCICAASMMAFVGCGGEEGAYTTKETLNGKTTEEKYDEIMATIDGQSENFSSLVQYDIHCTANVQSMTIDMDLQMTSTVKMSGNDFYAFDFVDAGEFMGMDMGSMSSKVWYVGGTAYLESAATGEMVGSVPNAKMKCTVTMEKLCQLAGLEEGELFNPIYDFSDTAFEDVKFNVGESDSYFEIVMKGDEASAYAQKLLEKQGMAGSFNIPQVNYKFMMDKEGNFDYVKVDFDVTASINGDSYKYNYDGKITFSDIGTTTVAAPEGGENWTTVTPA